MERRQDAAIFTVYKIPLYSSGDDTCRTTIVGPEHVPIRQIAPRAAGRTASVTFWEDRRRPVEIPLARVQQAIPVQIDAIPTAGIFPLTGNSVRRRSPPSPFASALLSGRYRRRGSSWRWPASAPGAHPLTYTVSWLTTAVGLPAQVRPRTPRACAIGGRIAPSTWYGSGNDRWGGRPGIRRNTRRSEAVHHFRPLGLPGGFARLPVGPQTGTNRRPGRIPE